MWPLIYTFSWQEVRHQPWRHLAAVLAVMLGVALAFSVHLINNSALEEFQRATRAVNGQPDLEIRPVQGDFDEALFGQVATLPQVRVASPVLDATLRVRDADGQPAQLRLLGLDALVLPAVAPALMPQSAPGRNDDRLALLLPDRVFLNAAARALAGGAADALTVLGADGTARRLAVAGSVAATGPALAVMDIGAAQSLLGRAGRLSRIDLRLAEGADPSALANAIRALPGWTPALRLAQPQDDAERISNLSRAYRVNLTVLALVALFTGAFLVFSVLALSVAKRAQQFALLGVLGLTARQRLRLVLIESLALGAAGSAAGLALGLGLAWAALRLLGGDLGGGYFRDVAPALRLDAGAAATYGVLGVLAALAGGWWPARAAQRLPEAQTLKGLGDAATGAGRLWPALALMAAGGALAHAPPVFGMPLAAYLSVALLLVGGIAALPWLILALYGRLAPRLGRRLLPLMAVERARRMRGSAAIALSGVVASLALSVALTVMVASFRESVTRWLDVVLPADLYVRAAGGSGGDAAPFDAALLQAAERLPGVERGVGQRLRSLQLDAALPAVTLLARAIDAQAPGRSLPLTGPVLPAPPGRIAVYVSEPMVSLHGAQVGGGLPALDAAFGLPPGRFFVAGVWRDYARQFGAVALDRADFTRLTGDSAASELSLWLAPGADEATVRAGLRRLARDRLGSEDALEIASAAQLRATSLRIFDRSFAVTYWLQAVAIAIGLFGIAASFSAQVLARRKEFGLLAHLGFTQAQVRRLVAGEGAAWTLIGAVAGLGLGIAVSAVLVKVVNPQSFHWTMDMLLPAGRLGLLCAAVIAAGTATAWLSARAAASRDMVLAVKEDW
ncbi:ABC transporter permease [Pseudacidovorax intermedius]|uniref:ABC transporter permease n=1 Tax=Pseudacidovorax intermedius TaxID=433924 RepID=A0A147GX51_9BURK|nr:ABC transporter permease [Pseudacidovorax intermedius]KTT22179.1 ABC transporter permease [Pseudacidovorax intermedius]